jgi:hypothetical protein
MKNTAAPYGLRRELEAAGVCMPVTASAIAGAAISGIAAGGGAALAGTTILGLSTTASAIAIGAGTFALSLAASAASQALAPDPPSLGSPLSNDLSDRAQQVRQPINARRMIYGEARVSGPILFVESTDDNKYLHMIVAMADHKVHQFDAVYLDEYPIYRSELDGNGLVQAPNKYDGLVRIKFGNGADDQAADADLVAETGATDSYRFRGIAYVYVRLEYDQDVFPAGIPNISAWIKGKEVKDVRDGAIRWTPNSALCVRDYLLTSTTDGGVGYTAAEIDDAYTAGAANTCDEIVATQPKNFEIISVSATGNWMEHDGRLLELVTGDRVKVSSTGSVPAGLVAGVSYYVIVNRRKRTDDGADPQFELASTYADALAGKFVDITDAGSGDITVTKTGEPRYTLNGTVKQSRQPDQILTDMLTSMAGYAVHVGDTWKLFAGSYRSPTLTLDEDDARDTIGVRTRHSRRERFNAVKGVYAPEIQDGVPTDYPVYKSDSAKTEDGERLWGEHDLPFTTRPHQAQRLAKIKLRRHRNEIRVSYPANLRALQTQPGDIVAINNDRFGWSEKPFEVVSWQLAVETDENDVPRLGVDMELRETAPDVYSWADTEETAVDPAPETVLTTTRPAAPTGLSVTYATTLKLQIDGTISWDLAADQFVRKGGLAQVQFKLSSASNWKPAVTVPGDQTEAEVAALAQNTDYDFRVRFISANGAQSDWTAITSQTTPAADTVDGGDLSDQVVSTTTTSTTTGVSVPDNNTQTASVTLSGNGPSFGAALFTLTEGGTAAGDVDVWLQVAGKTVERKTVSVPLSGTISVATTGFQKATNATVAAYARAASASPLPDISADTELTATLFNE